MNSFKNYTPHEIHVQTPLETFIFHSDGNARVEEEQSMIGEHGGIELRFTTYKEITGIPEPKEGIKYIVSMVVAQANTKLTHPRNDLVCPDSGKSCLRNEKGMITAVTGFII